MQYSSDTSLQVVIPAESHPVVMEHRVAFQLVTFEQPNITTSSISLQGVQQPNITSYYVVEVDAAETTAARRKPKPRRTLVKCPKCEYASKRSNVTRHVNTVHRERAPVACCSEMFSSRADFLEHFDKMHKDRKNSFVCSVCPMAFDNKHRLQRHQFKHEGSLPFRCGECDYASASIYNVRRHARDMHQTSDTTEVRHGSRDSTLSLDSIFEDYIPQQEEQKPVAAQDILKLAFREIEDTDSGIATGYAANTQFVGMLKEEIDVFAIPTENWQLPESQMNATLASFNSKDYFEFFKDLNSVL